MALTKVHSRMTADNYVSVLDFGAVGDFDEARSTGTDNTVAFDAAVAFCRTNNVALHVPRGKYYITSPLATGVPINLFGDGIASSQIHLEFSTAGYFLEYTGVSGNHKTIEHIEIRGATAGSYGTGNEKFLKSANGNNLKFENFLMDGLGEGINLVNSWGTKIRNMRASFIKNPLRFTYFNGGSVRDSYIFGFKDTAISISRGLAPIIDNVTIEDGDMDADPAVNRKGQAINLTATQSAVVSNIYLERDMDADFVLNEAGGRACMNTLITNVWTTSTAARIIDARAYKGLTIDNITLDSPDASQLIDFTNRGSNYADPIYVGYVAQVSQTANGVVGDVKEIGDSCIPLCEDNLAVICYKPHPNVGTGSVTDVNNLASHTAKDGNSYRAYVLGNGSLTHESAAGGLTCTSSTTTGTYGTDSTGINVYSDHYATIQLYMTGVMTHSASANSILVTARLKNDTTSDSVTHQNTYDHNDTYTRYWNIPVQPGMNSLVLELKRDNGASGQSNTFTASDILVVQKR